MDPLRDSETAAVPRSPLAKQSPSGRAGMHTEGLIIFSDPSVYDGRRSESWKFLASVELLSPEQSESTTSSLLELLSPLQQHDGRVTITMSAPALVNLMLLDEESWLPWANRLVASYPQHKFDANALAAELRRRRRMIAAIESYLMANRQSLPFEEFKASVEQLSMATLAYHLASAEVRPAIASLFSSVAEFVDRREPSPDKQAVYSKTLLGVRSAVAIERWVERNREALLTLRSNEDWVAMVWPLFADQLEDKFFHDLLPDNLAIELARQWLSGTPYQAMIAHATAEGGSKPRGTKRSRLTGDDVVGFCESALGFESSLVLAAVAQFLFGENGQDDAAAPLLLFQKALKYGLPDWLSISCYEFGFADRVIAQHLGGIVRARGFLEMFFPTALESHGDEIATALNDYPQYFASVLAGRLRDGQ